MELKLVEKGKDKVRVEFEGVDEALVNLFIAELLKNEDVKEANYTRKYMEEDAHVLYVSMSKGKPITAMKKAAENLSDEFKRAKKMLQKE